MKKWIRLLIATIEAILVLAVLYFEPTHSVYGKVWGEAFYHDRPTSYWRKQIDRWVDENKVPDDAKTLAFVFDVVGCNDEELDEWDNMVFRRNQSGKRRVPTFFQRLQARFAIQNGGTRPKVLRGDPKSDAVLMELNCEVKYKTITDAAPEVKQRAASMAMDRTRK